MRSGEHDGGRAVWRGANRERVSAGFLMGGLDMEHGLPRTLQQPSHLMDSVPFPSEWDPRLSVGDQYIDTQHAMLFYLIAQLKEALASDEGRNHLVKILDEVKKY